MGAKKNQNANAASQTTLDVVLQKALDKSGGKSFDELPEFTNTLESREYPDFGVDVPEGEYYTLAKFDIHDWKNSRGKLSQIPTLYVCDENGEIFEIQFSNFFASEFDFIKQTKNDDGDFEKEEIKCNPIFPFTPSRSKRAAAINTLEQGTKIKVCHARGHYDNPDAVRVFNFTRTWVERA